MNRNIIMAIVAVLVLLGIGGFFLMNNNATAPSPSPEAAMTAPTTSPEVTDTPDALDSESTGSADSEEEVREISVESNGLNFTPATIRVKLGEKVRVTYKNNMGRHDWSLDEFNAKTDLINAGATDTVEFTASKKGSFVYYCSVPGHREAGMKGTLIVE
jgi:plastocyanin